MYTNQTGSHNVALGYFALNGSTTGSYNTVLGSNVYSSTWNYSNVTTVGCGAEDFLSQVVKSSNALVLGGQPSSGYPTIYMPVFNTGSTSANRVLYVTPSGAVTTSSSSLRYKREVMPLDADRYNRETFMKIKPIRYRTKPGMEDANVQQIGFIAEDLHDISLHEMVIYNEKGECENIHYERMSPFVVKVVQEQEEEFHPW
jgi:hypothetical protein